jgi:hypothetical protein
MGQYESEAWFDEETDFLLVKVRVWEKAPDGKTFKRGMIFKMSAEYLATLPYVAEGGSYTHKLDSSALEFVGMEEESDEAICNDGRDISVCCKAPTKRVSDTIWICTKCGK